MKSHHFPIRCFSGSTLKIIAIVSMTVDHVAYFVMARGLGMQGLRTYDCLRGVGRLAFPIFAFLIVEGYVHTRHLGRYTLTLLLTAFVSDIPWRLLVGGGSHNVVFTLLLGLTAIHLTDNIKPTSWMVGAPTLCTALLATWLNTDYSWHGIGLMMVFFLFRERPLLTIPFGLPFLLEYGTIGPLIGLAAPLAYSGSRGFIKGQAMKHLFYLYYPLHLMVIWSVVKGFLQSEPL